MPVFSDPPEASREIHPKDGMWQPGETWYFKVGRSGLRAVELALAESWLDQPRSILDLPCGYGRVGRYLRAAYPDADMHFCDIDGEGADFCARQFGGNAIHSVEELTDVDLPMVDLIWVGSLFTHVDAARTRRWLEYLARHLNPHGLLVATFHGIWSLDTQKTHPMIDEAGWERIREGFERDGYGYAPYDQGRNGDYGVSLTRPSWLCDAIAAIPNVRMAGFHERGWSDNHDVVVLAQEDRPRPWKPSLPEPGPR